MNKYKSNFFNNCYEWLFTEEEREPIGFIATFFLIILIATTVCLFLISASKHIMWI